MVWYGMEWYGMVWNGMVWEGKVREGKGREGLSSTTKGRLTSLPRARLRRHPFGQGASGAAAAWSLPAGLIADCHRCSRLGRMRCDQGVECCLARLLVKPGA